jgi:tetratricopeptide (TPR) repeat protein
VDRQRGRQQSYNRGIELKRTKHDEAIPPSERPYRATRPFSRRASSWDFELRRGRSGEALRYFGQVADRIPFYGEVHLLIGDIYFQRESYRDAAFHFERAMETSFLDKSAATSFTSRAPRRSTTAVISKRPGSISPPPQAQSGVTRGASHALGH